MNANKKYLILIVSFFFIYCVSIFINTSTHEQIHSAIASSHFCTNSTITTEIIGQSKFECFEYLNRTNEVKLNEINLHILNEIVTYNLRSLVQILLLCTLTIVVAIQFKHKK